ncbi:response regulator transcription factor [Kitasatospora sp. NPDC004272]
MERGIQLTHGHLSGLRDASHRIRQLSERRREVLALIGQDLSNQEIARVLHIEERTVKAHTAALFDQLGLDSRVKLAQVALLNGIQDCT